MKTILTFLLIIASFTTFAQAKKDTTKVKPVYKKVVTLDLADFNTFTEALQQWKRLAMYDPSQPAEQKVRVYQDIEAYSQILFQKIKVDSIEVKPPVKKK